MPVSSPARPFATPADCAACRQSIRQGSKSFYLASLLMPAAAREPAYAVYAFCRMADDMVDGGGSGPEAIAEIRRALDHIYARRPADSFVERAFADVVRDFAIPRAIPDAMVEGLEWDVEGRSYETLSDLVGYAMRVAGTVGVMMTLVMGRREPEVLARACDLGVAMQLTNICRDVGEDARNGRIYLPLSQLRTAGLSPVEIGVMKRSTPALRAVIVDLLGEAERLYGQARPGIGALPAGSRTGIAAARLLYREIGRLICEGIDPLRERAVVAKGRKLALLGRAAAQPHSVQDGLGGPALAEARFLIDAVVRSRRTVWHDPLPQWWNVQARTTRMIELLARFERRSTAAG
ncbi:squalene/phytoene synthase family protein [Chelativorans sp. ZYF759]|uniref:phytoene/squalene synthase family protein n=1 Tax=Chelativorans sp. ZYF759 TaxID=2692213 RepID=UPI00145F99D0|nr:phytoene/squalene synthase family protein [Chelativorans sp. ZYF759]NMG41849.1 squalene/phytoene synthase family protein [Chelativorans sp. ZYF759]